MGMSFDINLDFRPANYFWPLPLETHLLSTVKGAERQNDIRQRLAAGCLDEVPDWMAQQSLDKEVRDALGRIHPHLMGGEYLPNLLPNEIEIARISLESVTGDVISIRARRGRRRIYYRIVDEYGSGSYLQQPTRKSSIRPISLGQLEQMIEEADTGLGIIRYNWECGTDNATLRNFLQATSPFYPDLVRLYRYRVDAWLALAEPEPDDSDADMPCAESASAES